MCNTSQRPHWQGYSAVCHVASATLQLTLIDNPLVVLTVPSSFLCSPFTYAFKLAQQILFELIGDIAFSKSLLYGSPSLWRRSMCKGAWRH